VHGAKANANLTCMSVEITRSSSGAEERAAVSRHGCTAGDNPTQLTRKGWCHVGTVWPKLGVHYIMFHAANSIVASPDTWKLVLLQLPSELPRVMHSPRVTVANAR
jgi:hypothetical protein